MDTTNKRVSYRALYDEMQLRVNRLEEQTRLDAAKIEYLTAQMSLQREMIGLYQQILQKDQGVVASNDAPTSFPGGTKVPEPSPLIRNLTKSETVQAVETQTEDSNFPF